MTELEGQGTGRGTRAGSPSPDVARDLGHLHNEVHTLQARNADLSRSLEDSRRQHETADRRVAELQMTVTDMSRTAGTRAQELARVEAELFTARAAILGQQSRATVDAARAAVEEVGKRLEVGNSNVAGDEASA